MLACYIGVVCLLLPVYIYLLCSINELLDYKKLKILWLYPLYIVHQLGISSPFLFGSPHYPTINPTLKSNVPTNINPCAANSFLPSPPLTLPLEVQLGIISFLSNHCIISNMAETQTAPATVEINDAIFCTHYKEVVRFLIFLSWKYN